MNVFSKISEALKPGTKIKLENTTYTVRGTLLYSLEGKEYDEEWERYTTIYTEFSLERSNEPAAEENYLVYEDSIFYLGRGVQTPGLIVPENADTKFEIPGNKRALKPNAYGTTKVLNVQGQIDDASKGDEWRFAEYSTNEDRVITGVEKNPVTNETYTYEEHQISTEDVVSGLGLTELANEIKTEKKRVNDRNSSLARWMFMFFGAAFACLILYWVLDNAGTVFFSQSMSAQSGFDETWGPIALHNTDSIYKININGYNLPEEGVAVAAELLDSNQQPINISDGNLWSDEDSGSTNKSLAFHIDRPGNYFLHATIDTTASSTNTLITISMVSDAKNASVMIPSIILFALAGTGCMLRRKSLSLK